MQIQPLVDFKPKRIKLKTKCVNKKNECLNLNDELNEQTHCEKKETFGSELFPQVVRITAFRLGYIFA